MGLHLFVLAQTSRKTDDQLPLPNKSDHPTTVAFYCLFGFYHKKHKCLLLSNTRDGGIIIKTFFGADYFTPQILFCINKAFLHLTAVNQTNCHLPLNFQRRNRLRFFCHSLLNMTLVVVVQWEQDAVYGQYMICKKKICVQGGSRCSLTGSVVGSGASKRKKKIHENMFWCSYRWHLVWMAVSGRLHQQLKWKFLLH